MARRRFTVIFTVLGFALFVSIGGFLLLYLAVGREPSVPSNTTLVLKVGGDLTEVAPANVVGYLRGTKAPTVRSIVDNLRKAKKDARVSSVLLKPTGFDSPYWGKVQEIRDAVLEGVIAFPAGDVSEAVVEGRAFVVAARKFRGRSVAAKMVIGARVVVVELAFAAQGGGFFRKRLRCYRNKIPCSVEIIPCYAA